MKIIIGFIIGIFPFLLFAQEEKVEIDILRVEQGITHRDVNKVQQDPWVFIWIATKDGLNKHGVHEFVHYKSEEPENKIPEDNIWKINENGELLKEYNNFSKNVSSWADQMQLTADSTLWVLFNKGQVYYLKNGEEDFMLHYW